MINITHGKNANDFTRCSERTQLFLPNVPLPDEHSGMVDRLGHARLEHEGLKPALEKVLHSKSQHVIELVLALVQQTVLVHPSQQGFTLKDPTRVLLVKGQKISRIVTDTAQSILNPPELPLAPQAVLANKLQLSVQTLLLIGTSGLLKSLPIYK